MNGMPRHHRAALLHNGIGIVRVVEVVPLRLGSCIVLICKFWIAQHLAEIDERGVSRDAPVSTHSLPLELANCLAVKTDH